MYDDSFDILPVPDRQLFLRVGALLAATGALVGGCESLVLAWRLPMQLTIGEMLRLCVVAVIADAAFAGALGLMSGLVAQLVLNRSPRWRRYTVGYFLGGLGLLAFYMAPLLWDVSRQGRYEVVAGLAAICTLICVALWYNARFWVRRMLIGAAPVFGLRVLAPAGGLVLALLAALLHQNPAPQVLPMSPTNLVLITIDTLRRDHLGAYGGNVATPRIDQLAREGLLLNNAVSPLPETAPAHASMLTGLHPLENRVVSNGLALSPSFRTLQEQLYAAGYRTGAFVSSFAVDSRIGLDQGFEVYDDDFAPFISGLSELQVTALTLRLIMRLGNPAAFPFLLERSAPRTINRALRWAVAEKKHPIFLWVHLFEPHAPYEPHGESATPPSVVHREILPLEPGYPYTSGEQEALRALYAGEVAYTDLQVGVLLDGLRAAGKLDDARIVVISDHGESLGEHGVMFTHIGLYEPVVQIPFIFWSSSPDWEPGSRTDRQVSVMDVANTLLEASGVPMLAQTHSVPLQILARGAEVPEEALSLTGRGPVATDRGTAYGLRTGEGVKCIVSENNSGEIYDLSVDPGETNNIAELHTEAMSSCRSHVDLLRGRAIERKVDPETADMLEALGYVDAEEASSRKAISDPQTPAPAARD